MPFSPAGLCKAVVCTTLLALVPTALHAENKDGSFEVGLFTTWVRFDPQSDLDSRFAPSLLVAYNFTKRHGGEMVFTSVTATPDQGTSFPVDVDIVRLGYTYNAYPREKMVSFFRLGVGVQRIDPEENADASERLEDDTTDPMIYSGGGLRYFIKPWLAVRLAASVDFIDAGNGFPNADIQATGDLGLSFLMGGREAAPPADEEAPSNGTTPPSDEKPPEEKPPAGR
ncbi:MAG: hypothetical protein ACREAA_09870 [Candidatus Polarisedimenticolia bacterium]